ncbi:MAG TPA: four helix bundle protein [Opitutaceae bacterium]|nr:four helix bundle protein [Opitutaceae bacterium]
MTKGKQFEDIEVWQLAKDVALDVYGLVKRSPLNRDFSFRDQFQRAAISIMSNIAEGLERSGTREFIHFLYIAKGSAAEVRSLVKIGGELGYLQSEEKGRLLSKLTSVSRQLAGFIKYLENDLATRSPEKV